MCASRCESILPPGSFFFRPVCLPLADLLNVKRTSCGQSKWPVSHGRRARSMSKTTKLKRTRLTIINPEHGFLVSHSSLYHGWHLLLYSGVLQVASVRLRIVANAPADSGLMRVTRGVDVLFVFPVAPAKRLLPAHQLACSWLISVVRF